MMDRSYWSKENVVKASRDFVCIRLATYEDPGEVKFLSSIYRGRSGQLENTVFALLDSDGKRQLARSGRSPDFAFFGDKQFVTGLEKIAHAKKSRPKRFSDTQLPLVKNVELALNIASSDKIQLIIVVGENDSTVQELSRKALPLAWNETIGGQFVFAKATTKQELKPVGVDKIENGLLIIEPGQFGMSGKLVTKFAESFESSKTIEKLAKLSKAYSVSKDYRQHVQAGISLGIEWKTRTPVTDQQSLRALERSRGR